MALRNAFEDLSTEAKQDAIISALASLLSKDVLTNTQLRASDVQVNDDVAQVAIQSVVSALGTTATVDTVRELLKRIYLALDGVEGKLDTLNTNTDEVETKLDTLNAKNFATEATLEAARATLALINSKLAGTLTTSALTDTQLRASDVKVSLDGEVVNIQGNLNVNALTDAQLRAADVQVNDNVSQVYLQDIIASLGTGPLTNAQLRNTPVPVDVGANLSVTASFDSRVSTLNSRTTPLAADEVFTGTWEEVTNYASITAAITTDQASATDGAVAQFSDNATDVIYQTTATIPANLSTYFSFPPVARYFRIIYTNGPVAQTTLQASITYSFNAIQSPLGAIGSQMDEADVVGQVKAAVMGKVMTGPYAGLFLPPAVTTDGHLSTRVENFPAERTLTERMLAKAPATGYTLWFDTADVSHIYTLEAPTGTAASAVGFRGVRVTTVAGNPVGAVEVNTSGTLTFDNRTTDAGWAA